MEDTAFEPVDPEVQVLKLNKESGFKYRERREEDWRENYTLYRDRVLYNRLTQRQSVNLPLMKQTIRTLLKDVDDMPVLYFENRDNDKQAEVFQNEYWKYTLDCNNMEVRDIVDKKQVMFYGRSFDQIQVIDGMIRMSIIDPEDILVDRYLDPTDLDSARYLIHTHIFVPLATLEKNSMYNQQAVADLKKWFASEQGLIKATENQDMYEKKMQKLEDLGLDDAQDPILGETYVELTLHFVYDTRPGEEEEERFLKVEAEDMKILMSKPLAGEDGVIGNTKSDYWKTHVPYNSWADDVDMQDFWTDGVADIVRTPNKILNSFYSQMIENRTMRNFGMNYYDATDENFIPQTYEPEPFGWYGVPGNPNDLVKKVDIPDLSESLDEMEFVIGMTEKASGATATQQGVQTERQVTLGEVQLALGEAKERVKGMSKFYTPVWKKRGEKFLMMIEAAADQLDAVEIYKKGINTDKLYKKEIEPGDWMTQSGYQVKIWSQDEKDTQNAQAIEKLNAVRSAIPGNTKLDEVYQRKLLEFADLKPEDINEIMKIEDAKRAAMATATMGGGLTGDPTQPGGPQPTQPGQPDAGSIASQFTAPNAGQPPQGQQPMVA